MPPEISGRGDPARTLALLWRHAAPPQEIPRSRGPKPRLDVDRIVDTAIGIADAEGLPALSMRRVADQLGVGAMSLYTYVPGKAELIDLMLDTVNDETARPDDVPGGWRAKLELIARENWALHRRHPWMLQVATTRPPLGPNVSAKYEYELAAVDGIGLADLEMDAVLDLVLAHATGAARRVVETAQVQQNTGMTDRQWWEAHVPYLEKLMDRTRYPLGSRVGTATGEAYGAASNPEHAFEFGLARVLDGIATFIAARNPTTS